MGAACYCLLWFDWMTVLEIRNDAIQQQFMRRPASG